MFRRTLFLSLALTAVLCDIAVAQIVPDPLEIHVLNRLAFGPNADSEEAIGRLGVDGWIAGQLHPETIAEPGLLIDRLDRLETPKLNTVELYERYRPPPQREEAADPATAKAARQREKIVMREAAEARLMRAIDSPRQLQEVMVDFWFNHFNVFAGKGLDRLWTGNYEGRAIRPYALGHFRTLLEVTARHPAMLFYLDNWQNTAPGSPGAKGNETGLNENYARELMELHTLGVDGGYTQADVVALARILTGWGFVKPHEGRGRGRERGHLGPVDDVFAFDPNRHDFGDKVFLGQTIRGDGSAEVERALDILAASPATAHHLSFELAQYFVADEPSPALVDRLTHRWMETGGDIRAVLAMLFASPEFRDPANFGDKFKTPFQYVISATRAAGSDVMNFRPLLGTLKRLGEPLYGCLTPDGYKNTRDAWLNADSLTMRIGFATALGAGHLRLDHAVAETDDEDAPTPPPQAPPDTPVPLDSGKLVALLGPGLSAKTQGVVATSSPALKAAVILGSPDFMAR